MNRFTLLAGFGLALAGSTALVHADENWKAALTSPDDAAQTDTGVVGMSSDEAASYAADAQDSGATDEPPDNFIHNRRRFVIREIKFNADWDTDPTALPAMIEQFKRRTGVDGQALQPRLPLTLDDPEVNNWSFIYMTAHNAFTLSDGELAGLRKYLKNGGFLYADDCLYGFPFGPAFHGEMRRVFEGKELKPFNLDTPVFGTLLKQKYSWGATNEAGLPNTLKTNAFECIDVDGRMAILYTPPDIGCHWEISSPPTPSNPLGAGMHGLDLVPGARESAYRMGVNIFFYAQTH